MSLPLKMERPPRNDNANDRADWYEQVERVINLILARQGNWGTIANVTPTTAYDATATNLNELANVVGTLITDLKTKGVLGP